MILRLMFWTSQGNFPAIKFANMDGSSFDSLITTDIQVPEAITLDLEELNIYWTDTRKKTIESVTYGGNNRRVIVQSVVSSGIVICGDAILWSFSKSPHIKVFSLKSLHHKTNLTGELSA